MLFNARNTRRSSRATTRSSGGAANSVLALPGVQRLLNDPRNATAREALARAGDGCGAGGAGDIGATAVPTGAAGAFARLAGVDADVVVGRTKRAASASRASRSGARGELVVIEEYHAAAAARGVACMEKVATPTKHIGPAQGSFVGRPGAFTAVRSARTWVDCHGYTLRGAPRAVLEEVKAVTAMRHGHLAPFRTERVEAHQKQCLLRAHGAGHIAVVTLVFGEEPLALTARVYTVPAAWLLEDGRSQVYEREVAAWRVTPVTYLARETEARA